VHALVTVVEEMTGSLVATLLDDSTGVGVTVGATWSPGAIADGDYRFDVVVADAAGPATASVVVTADTVPPSVTLGAIVPNPFDPVGIADHDSMSVPFTVVTDPLTPTTTTVTIRQGTPPAVVATLGTLAGGGSGEFFWKGLRQGSANPVSGLYQVHARSADLAGNSDSASVSVYLDVQAPIFRFDAGHSDTTMTTAFPVLLSGTVRDSTLVTSVRVSYDGGMTFGPVDSVSAVANVVQWQLAVPGPPPSPGIDSVVVRALDIFGDVAGHRADHKFWIAYDTAFPVVVADPVVLNANASVLRGERLRIRTFWDRDGLAMRADASDLDTSFNPAQAGAGFISEGGGVYLWQYDVSYANTRPSNQRTVVIRATTPYLSASVTVNVTLVDGRSDPQQLLYVDRNWFDPLAGEEVTISSELASKAITVDVWNLAGRLVRQLQGNGIVRWDGGSDEGRPVASGVYFLRLRTDDGEEKRKVAVVRGGRR